MFYFIVNDSAGSSVNEMITVVYSTGPTVSVGPSSPIYTDRDEVNVTVSAQDTAPLTSGYFVQYVKRDEVL